MGLTVRRQIAATWTADEEGRPVLCLRITSWSLAMRVLAFLEKHLAR